MYAHDIRPALLYSYHYTWTVYGIQLIIVITDLTTEPDQLGLLILLEHSKARVENVLQEEHEELLLYPSCIHTLLTNKLHLGREGEEGEGGRGREREGGGREREKGGKERERREKEVGGRGRKEEEKGGGRREREKGGREGEGEGEGGRG